jgi:hypothetical protein
MILELGAGADILRAIGVIYWVLTVGAIGLVWWLGKRWWIKVPLTLAILVLFIYPPYRSAKQDQEEHAVFMARYEPAKALFENLCKTRAGEKIYRTVENAEGVLLLKVRPKSDYNDWTNPMWPAAALQKESVEDWYIRSFLFDKRGGGIVQAIDGVDYQGHKVASENGIGERGYGYVEVVDPADRKHYRYTLRVQPREHPYPSGAMEIALVREPAKGPPPRYGITYEENVDPELRKHWVAGTTLKVLDLKTNEVMAEKTYYVFETGLGSKAGFRSPWGLAASCERLLGAPRLLVGSQDMQTRHFADQIIKPIQAKESK